VVRELEGRRAGDGEVRQQVEDAARGARGLGARAEELVVDELARPRWTPS
jgi:hypothetical protein